MQDDLEQRVQHLITQPWSSLEAARAIIPMVQAATLELAAEALRTISDERLSKSTDAESGDMALGMLNAADWLQQRAKGVTDA